MGREREDGPVSVSFLALVVLGGVLGFCEEEWVSCCSDGRFEGLGGGLTGHCEGGGGWKLMVDSWVRGLTMRSWCRAR